jgi:ribA/ribD-fused uncharacterized protein
MFVMGQERDYIVHDDNNIKGFFGDYRFLSNFEVSPVEFEGLMYPSSENAYQAAKCNILSERQLFVNITPSESKKLGRKVEQRPDWEDVKIEIMSVICYDKFQRNPELRQKLVDTGDRYLEETNHWNDKFWGVFNGVGLNNLGKVLMGIRNTI